MSILSNVAIAAALESNDLVIDPLPNGEPGDKDCYDTCSVHLHLADSVYVPKDTGIAFDLDQAGDDLKETLATYFDKQPIPADGYPLGTGKYVIAVTREKVGFPVNGNGNGQLAGRIEGRSRFARIGLLVHFTAPTLHANWTGKVSLELKNLGTKSILLRAGSAICQLIVERVEGDLRYSHAGAFDDQKSPTGGR